jgi:GntR family carbon starvation induced transcriptional regulator
MTRMPPRRGRYRRPIMRNTRSASRSTAARAPRDRDAPSVAAAPQVSTAPQDVALQDAASFDVYRRLRSDIVDCRLQPDERLRFEVLRSRYDAGVGTLREALSHLVSDGLVRMEAGRGFRVAPVSLPDMLDIAEWRVEFEVRAITRSIQLGDDAWEAEIVTAYHLLAKCELPAVDAAPELWEQWTSRHRRFHDALAAACGSPWLLHFRSVLFEQARRYRRLTALHGPRLRRKEEEHRELMEAVLARDTSRAARLAEHHIRRTVDAALKHVPGLDVLVGVSRPAGTAGSRGAAGPARGAPATPGAVAGRRPAARVEASPARRRPVSRG